MKLEQWIYVEKMTTTEFAKLVGANKASIHRYMYEMVIPSKEMMQSIYVATRGAVTANDFYELDYNLFHFEDSSIMDSRYNGEVYEDEKSLI